MHSMFDTSAPLATFVAEDDEEIVDPGLIPDTGLGDEDLLDADLAPDEDLETEEEEEEDETEDAA